MNDRARLAIASRALEAATLLSERTLLAEVLIDELIDRLGHELRSGAPDGLDRWLAGVYERHAGLHFLAPLFAATWEQVRASAQAPPATSRRIDAALESAARAARRVERARESQSLDEVDACIADLVARLDDHDPLTAEHSKAVSAWCTRIARKLGLDAAETQLVKRGGLLHDVGKVGTPDEILNAPRGLTPDEWIVMQRHTVDGAQIVADIPMLAEFLPAIRNHHERLDGKGYPDGIRGESIPLAARVVSVADCFNAMIGRRPYRPPLSPHRALDLLQKSAGAQLDPEIVEALVAVVTGRHDAG